MTSVKARVTSRKNKNGMCSLFIQIIREREKREIYTPYKLERGEFNLMKEQARNKGRNVQRTEYIREVNLYLANIKEVILSISDRLAQRGNYTVADVAQAYKRQSDFSNVFVYTEALIDEFQAEDRDGTAANYHSALRAFEMFVGNREFAFDQITREVVAAFESHLKQKGNSPNTIWCYLYQLRAIYNRAVAENILFEDFRPFDKMEIKKEETAKRAISATDMEQVAQIDLFCQEENVQLARDLFLFSSYTRGMAFADMCYLTTDNMKGNTLSYRRKKTGQLLEMKIEEPLRALILKYADRQSPYLLPMLRTDDSYRGYRNVQRKLNKRMLTVGKLLGFDFPLTFYVARHTWASQAHLQGIPMAVISAALGHTSEKTTRIYLAQINHQVLDDANHQVIQGWGKRKGREKKETRAEKRDDL